MKRWEAIEQIMTMAGNALVIHANGMISRESFAYQDRQENFYMVGSMGLASSIGLGLATSRLVKRIVVLDGDGNVLMNLGTIAMIGERQPRNLIHVVLDNEVYASTGGQRCISDQIKLDAFAQDAGYVRVHRVSRQAELAMIFARLMVMDGPSFLLVKIDAGNMLGIPRVGHEPKIIARRFREVAIGSRSSSGTLTQV